MRRLLLSLLLASSSSSLLPPHPVRPFTRVQWPGVVFALIVAFSTALPYAEMAKVYPEAGNAG